MYVDNVSSNNYFSSYSMSSLKILYRRSYLTDFSGSTCSKICCTYQVNAFRYIFEETEARNLFDSFFFNYFSICKLYALPSNLTLNLHIRQQQLQSLKNDQFDVLVIGCGATGAGITLDSASRGIRILTLYSS